MLRKYFTDEYTYFDKNQQKWRAKYIEDDKEKTKQFDNREDADSFLKQLKYRRQNPIYEEKSGIPVYDLMEQILNNKEKANVVSDSQYARIKHTLKIINQAPFVHRNIEEITPDEIQTFLNEMTKKYSNSSVMKIAEQFSQAFRYAFNKGYIGKNPMVEVVRPKSTKKDKVVDALTLSEQSKLVNYLIEQSPKDFPYKNAYLMQMFMGFRIGEVLSLTKDDIDLKNKLISINKTLSVDKNNKQKLSDSPKTKAGNRTLLIPDLLLPYIEEQIQFSNENGNELLFSNENNEYLSVGVASAKLKEITNNLGISKISTHSLRHTYATRSIEAGMSPVVLQKLLGHTDVSITLNTYTSVFDKYKKSELEKVNDYYMKQNLLNLNDANIIGLEEFNPIDVDYKIIDDSNVKEYCEEYTR